MTSCLYFILQNGFIHVLLSTSFENEVDIECIIVLQQKQQDFKTQYIVLCGLQCSLLSFPHNSLSLDLHIPSTLSEVNL